MGGVPTDYLGKVYENEENWVRIFQNFTMYIHYGGDFEVIGSNRATMVEILLRHSGPILSGWLQLNSANLSI